MMQATVVRELLGVFRLSQLFSTITCERCDKELGFKEASYRCKKCDVYYCMACASEGREGLSTVLNLQGMGNSSSSSKPALSVMVGDIMLCGPDAMGIHHAILVRSRLRPAPDMVKPFGLSSGMEVFSCDTVECTQSAQGEDTYWYFSKSFIQRDPRLRTATWIADKPPGSNTVELSLHPAPVKVLRHPLRPGRGGHQLDCQVFDRAVQQAAAVSKEYGWSTAIRASMQHFSSAKPALDAADYPSPVLRWALLGKLCQEWDSPPICSSVPIKVWQQYFVAVFGEAKTPNAEDVAVQHILSYIPLVPDATSPSTLVTELTKCGWVLHHNLEP